MGRILDPQSGRTMRPAFTLLIHYGDLTGQKLGHPVVMDFRFVFISLSFFLLFLLLF